MCDEFAVLMPGVANPRRGKPACRDHSGSAAHNSDTPETNSISTSIGIALYPDDATDRQSLLTHADTALYRAKNRRPQHLSFLRSKDGR